MKNTEIVCNIKKTFCLTDNEFCRLFPEGIGNDRYKLWSLYLAEDSWKHAGFKALKEYDKEIYEMLDSLDIEKLLFTGGRISLKEPRIEIPDPFKDTKNTS